MIYKLGFLTETEPKGFYIQREIYYKELTHSIMKVTSAKISTVSSLETQESQWCSFSLKAVGSRPRKSPCFSLCPKAGKSQHLSLKAVTRENPLLFSLLFYWDLQQIVWGPPVLGRAICFMQSIQMCISCRNTFAETQNNVWPTVWDPHDPSKLTNLSITDDDPPPNLDLQYRCSPKIHNLYTQLPAHHLCLDV